MSKIKNIFVILSAVIAPLIMGACTDEDSFTVSPSNLLTFSTDTLKLDTVFSKVPTPTYTFWVYNKSGDGIRCTNVRLANGNQTGFRVNVDGEYLSPTAGYQISDVEIRDKDSIRVLVELTSPMNGASEPQQVADDLVFLLESGVEQRVNLSAYSWDAELMRNVVVDKDMLIDGFGKPIVIYGGLCVDSFATLRIAAGTTLYFHSDAGLDVYGCLKAEGSAEKNVVFRGDRTDRMFDYLPYDKVSGQWKGVHFNSSSYDNELTYTDIHSTFDGVVCDSSDVSRTKLTLRNSIIHNCQGYGLFSVNSKVVAENTQITNAMNGSVAVTGGDFTINHCTLAQFYPFDSNRGAALYYTNHSGETPMPLLRMDCINSIVTGYAYDQVMADSMKDETVAYNYRFVNSMLRTPEPKDKDGNVIPNDRIINTLFENVEDTSVISGYKNFRLVDIDLQSYDFHLSEKSPAIGAASAELSFPTDRDGNQRDDKPDIGCYEFLEVKEDN